MTQSNSSAVVPNTPIGYVKESSQQLHAVSADGTTRVLSKGSPIYFGETVVNGSDATTVYLKMNDGTEIKLFSTARLTLDDTLLSNVAAAPADGSTQTAAAIEQVLQEEPAGAGPGSTGTGGGGDAAGGGGFGFVTLSRLDGALTPDSGFETTGPSVAFPEPQPEVLLQNPEEAQAEPEPVPPPVPEPEPELEPLVARPDENQISDTDLEIIDYEGEKSYEYQYPDGEIYLPAAIQGNVLPNDDAGAQLTGVSFQGNQGILNNGIWTIADPGGIWTLRVEAATGAYEFALLRPFPHTEPGIDTASLVFDYQVANDAGQTAATTLTIFITDDVPSVGRSVASSNADEGDLGEGEGAWARGYIDPDYGNDGPGSLRLSLDNPPQLTSGGEVIQYSLSEDGLTLTGSIGEGETTVFTLNLDNNDYSVKYQFELEQPLDHPGTGVDELTLNFTYDVTDGDGDTANSQGTLQVFVVDDTPTIECGEGYVTTDGDYKKDYEYKGQMQVNFGMDGASDPNEHADLSPLKITGISFGDDELYFDYANATPDINGAYQFGNFNGYDIEVVEYGTHVNGYSEGTDTLVFCMMLDGNDQYVFGQDYNMDETNVAFSVQAQDYDGDTADCEISVATTNDLYYGLPTVDTLLTQAEVQAV